MTNPVVAGLASDATSDQPSALREWMRRAYNVLADIVAREKVLLVTLTANVASTTITDRRIASTTVLLWQPTTANASAEIGAGTIYVSETGRVHGSAVVTHANNAQTDRTFRVKLGGV